MVRSLILINSQGALSQGKNQTEEITVDNASRNKFLSAIMGLSCGLLVPATSVADTQYWVQSQAGNRIQLLVTQSIDAPAARKLAGEFSTTIEAIRRENHPQRTLILCSDARGKYPRELNPRRTVAERESNAVWDQCPAERRGLYITPGVIKLARGQKIPTRPQSQFDTQPPRFANEAVFEERLEHLETNITASSELALDALEKLTSSVTAVLGVIMQIDSSTVRQHGETLSSLQRLQQLIRENHVASAQTRYTSVEGATPNAWIFVLSLFLIVLVAYVFYVRSRWRKARSAQDDLEREREANVITSSALRASLYKEEELQRDLDLAARNRAINAAAREADTAKQAEADQTIRMYLFLIAERIGCPLERHVETLEMVRGISKYIQDSAPPKGAFAVLRTLRDDIAQNGLTPTTMDDFWLLVDLLEQKVHLDLALLHAVEGDVPSFVTTLVRESKYLKHKGQLQWRGLRWIAGQLRERALKSGPPPNSTGTPQPN